MWKLEVVGSSQDNKRDIGNHLSTNLFVPMNYFL